MPDKFVEYVAADAPVPGANGDYNVERNGTAKALPAVVANVDLITWSAPTMPGLYRVFAGVVVDNGATSGQWLVRGHARKVGNGALVKVGQQVDNEGSDLGLIYAPSFQVVGGAPLIRIASLLGSAGTARAFKARFFMIPTGG